jgi:hypothetical protein
VAAAMPPLFFFNPFSPLFATKITEQPKIFGICTLTTEKSIISDIWMKQKSIGTLKENASVLTDGLFLFSGS